MWQRRDFPKSGCLQPGGVERADSGSCPSCAISELCNPRQGPLCLRLALGGLSHPVTFLTFRLWERERKATRTSWPCHSFQEHLQELPWQQDPQACSSLPWAY